MAILSKKTTIEKWAKHEGVCNHFFLKGGQNCYTMKLRRSKVCVSQFNIIFGLNPFLNPFMYKFYHSKDSGWIYIHV